MFLRKIVILFLMLASIHTFATKRYWVGTGVNLNWNATANWSSTSGGASGSSVPVAADSVYFDSNGIGQCSVNAAVSIKYLNISSGYTDTLKQNTYAITIGTSGAVMNGGTFSGGSATVTISGPFTQNGTNFISTSGILLIAGTHTFTSGTFAHNNGTVRYTGTFTVTGNLDYYDLSFPGGSVITFDVASTLIFLIC